MLNSTYQIQLIGFDSSKLIYQIQLDYFHDSIVFNIELKLIKFNISNSTQLLQLVKLKLIKFNISNSTSQIRTQQNLIYQIQLNYFHNLIVFSLSSSNSTNSTPSTRTQQNLIYQIQLNYFHDLIVFSLSSSNSTNSIH